MRSAGSACLIAFGFALAPSSMAAETMDLALRSGAFGQNREIPTRYTCEGEDPAAPVTKRGGQR
jgi:hypothetical protein